MPLFARKNEPMLKLLPPGSITPNPSQPRQHFSQKELEELSASIAQLGILQPLTVRASPNGGWELVSGERRLRAAMLAGLEKVPCLVTQADEGRSALIALVENIQRQDLDFWEEALALEKLVRLCGLSQEEAAKKVGKSQSAVANKLRLLKLPQGALRILRDAGCTERHARALLRLEEGQEQAAAYIAEHGLNVAQTEEYVERLLHPKVKGRPPVYFIKDVRLFLNTVKRGLSLMNAAGVDARCGREETDSEILLTIRIPK